MITRDSLLSLEAYARQRNERRRMLGLLRGIEKRVWAQVAASERVYAIADEDLERENDEKTSSVHFLRFELAAPMRTALARGAGLSMGVDHPQYRVGVEVPADIRAALAADLA